MLRRPPITLHFGLGLSLLLSACGQSPSSQKADPYANGADYPWSFTRPAGQLSTLALTPGVNTLFYEPILAATNGWGPIEVNRSNGEQGANDGRVLTLNGRTYARGFGTHAGSELSFGLQGSGAFCTRLNVDIGVDDEVGSRGSVVFQVFLDGRKVYDSGTMTGASATRSADVDLTGARELRLVVTDAGDGKHFDHADWANPRVTCTAGSAPLSGTADPSFGNGGVVDSGGADAVLEPGDTVAVADTLDGNFVLRRILPGGQTRQVVTDFGGQDVARAIARQADGKLILAGQSNDSFALARYNADLSLDTSFGTGGKVVTVVGSPGASTAYAVAVQTDGRIVAAGTAPVVHAPATSADRDVALVRYMANGTPDSSFGTGGTVFQNFSGPSFPDDAAYAVVVQPGGGIVVAGRSTVTGEPRAMMTRFTSAGAPDPSFNTYLATTYSTFYDLMVEPSGQLLVVGHKGRFNITGTVDRVSEQGLFLAGQSVAFTATSAFDQSFLTSVALQSDGKVLVSGVNRPAPSSGFLALARFNANLSVDASFAIAGQLRSSLRNEKPFSPEGALLVQSNGRIVVVGQQTSRYFP